MYYWLDLVVGGYIYEVVEGWMAGVEGGEGDESYVSMNMYIFILEELYLI